MVRVRTKGYYCGVRAHDWMNLLLWLLLMLLVKLNQFLEMVGEGRVVNIVASERGASCEVVSVHDSRCALSKRMNKWTRERIVRAHLSVRQTSTSRCAGASSWKEKD